LALDPLSIAVNGQLGTILVFMRRYDEAIVHLRQAIALAPTVVRPHLILAEALAHRGEYDQALSELEGIQNAGSEQTNVMAQTGYVYAVASRRADALAVVSALTARHVGRDEAAAGALGVVYAGLGDRDPAFRWLNEARLQGDPLVGDLKSDPRFDKLRSDPRFHKLLETVGLAQ